MLRRTHRRLIHTRTTHPSGHCGAPATGWAFSEHHPRFPGTGTTRWSHPALALRRPDQLRIGMDGGSGLPLSDRLNQRRPLPHLRPILGRELDVTDLTVTGNVGDVQFTMRANCKVPLQAKAGRASGQGRQPEELINRSCGRSLRHQVRERVAQRAGAAVTAASATEPPRSSLVSSSAAPSRRTRTSPQSAGAATPLGSRWRSLHCTSPGHALILNFQDGGGSGSGGLPTSLDRCPEWHGGSWGYRGT